MAEDTAIRRLRLERGLTQEEIAKRLEIAPATVSRWERESSRVTVPILRNLARVLSCDPSELLSPARLRKLPGEKEGKGIVFVKPATTEEEPRGFPLDFIAAITDVPPENLAFIVIVGDAMGDTLRQGDLCLVDTTAQIDRNGLYCLRRGDLAGVRRISLRINSEEVLVVADNPRYGPGEVVPIPSVDLVGRVIWRGGYV